MIVITLIVMSTTSTSSAKNCCESVTISSQNSLTNKLQTKSLNTYGKKHDINERPRYLSSHNDTMLAYSVTRQQWRVYANKSENIVMVFIKSRTDTHYVCPSNTKDWEYYKYTHPQEWRDDSTLSVTCNQEPTTATTIATLTSMSSDEVPKLVIIG